ncbi:MAG: flagellar hook-length control protein FliK [Candidatus Lambdaproteobacteria bacterium]|nr:flagellar hook-length control protein FliK [Candidatus Lambdaproteobacteria bacterium]
MIAGIINSAGIKEDPPATMNAPSGSSRGFDRALRQASNRPPAQRAATEQQRSSGSDPQVRQKYGAAAKAAQGSPSSQGANGAEPPGDAENIASPESRGEENIAQSQGKDEQSLKPGVQVGTDATASLAAVAPALTLVPQSADGGSTDVQAGAASPATPSVQADALQFNADTEGSQIVSRPGISAQIGGAAYRLTQHGGSEAQFAAQAGQTPQSGAVVLPRGMALQEAVPETAPKLTPPKDDTTTQLLNLARQPVARAPIAGALTPQQLVQQTLVQGDAQTRNQLMMTYGLNQSPQLAAGSTPLPQMGILGQPRFFGDAPLTTSLRQSAETREGSTATLPGPVQLPLAPAGVAQAQGAGAAVPSEHMLERMVHEARLMLGGNRNEASFKLHPEHLGEVTMKVTQHDGVIKLDLTVHNHAVKTLIESQMDELRQRLSAEHLGGGEFTFNVNVNQNDHQPREGVLTQAADSMAPLGRRPAEPGPAANLPPRLRPVWGLAGTGIYA